MLDLRKAAGFTDFFVIATGDEHPADPRDRRRSGRRTREAASRSRRTPKAKRGPNGFCSTTSISWCTSSARRAAPFTDSNGCGAARPRSISPASSSPSPRCAGPSAARRAEHGDARGGGRAAPLRACRRQRAHHRRDRHRQGSRRAHAASARPPSSLILSSSSTAPAWRRACSRPSSSATSVARSRTPLRRARAASSWPARAPSISIASTSCRSTPRPSCCDWSSRNRWSGSGRPSRSRFARASLPRPPTASKRPFADGRFRMDLYHRLRVLPIRIPPLRQRTGDVAVLARRLMTELTDGTRHHSPVLTRSALAILAAHDWPGNVRELRHVLERAVTAGGGGRHRRGRSGRRRALTRTHRSRRGRRAADARGARAALYRVRLAGDEGQSEPCGRGVGDQSKGAVGKAKALRALVETARLKSGPTASSSPTAAGPHVRAEADRRIVRRPKL